MPLETQYDLQGLESRVNTCESGLNTMTSGWSPLVTRVTNAESAITALQAKQALKANYISNTSSSGLVIDVLGISVATGAAFTNLRTMVLGLRDAMITVEKMNPS